MSILEAPESLQGRLVREMLDARSEPEKRPNIVSVIEPRWVQEFDAYANYLEAVACLHADGILTREEVTSGWWGYYIGRLSNADEVAEYVVLERHGWTGLRHVLNEIALDRDDSPMRWTRKLDSGDEEVLQTAIQRGLKNFFGAAAKAITGIQVGDDGVGYRLDLDWTRRTGQKQLFAHIKELADGWWQFEISSEPSPNSH